MSHFSKIQTNIGDLEILKQTLSDLDLNWRLVNKDLKDSNGINQVNIIIDEAHLNPYGFSWNGSQYELVADLQMWNKSIPIERFIEKITQKYAYNSIVNESKAQGFKAVTETSLEDGSIKLLLQKWSY